MSFLLKPRFTIWIGDESLRLLRQLASEKAPSETGGVLLGYWRSDKRTGVITDVVGPGPAAVHGRDFFEPDAKYQSAEIARIYELSGRITTYLGDWHTHPGGSTGLSAQDRRTLRTIAASPAARAPTPLMGILAGKEHWRMCLWVYDSPLGFSEWPRRCVAARVRQYG